MARKLVVIRDDDTNRFTDPKLLEKIYAHAFRRGFRISVSVIPRIDTSVLLSGRNSFVARGFTHEPCIPRAKRDTGFYAVSENVKLIAWLRKKPVEVCMHGYSHRKADFLSDNAPLIRHKVREGRGMLEHALGTGVTTFVPPHEALSKTSWGILAEEKLYVFRNIIRPLKDIVCTVPVFEYRPEHIPHFFSGFNGVVSYRHNTELGSMRPYLFSAYWDMEEAFETACSVFDRAGAFVMANHYWEFSLNASMVKWWNAFVDYMASHDIEPLTAREAVEVA